MFSVVSYVTFKIKSLPFQWLFLSLIKFQCFHWVLSGLILESPWHENPGLRVEVLEPDQQFGKVNALSNFFLSFFFFWTNNKKFFLFIVQNSFNLLLTHFNQILFHTDHITFLKIYFNHHCIIFLYHNQLSQEPRFCLSPWIHSCAWLRVQMELSVRHL